MDSGGDALTQAGAQRLATQIERAWSKRGYRVSTRVEQVIMPKGVKYERLAWVVRSNIGPAGFPPKSVGAS